MLVVIYSWSFTRDLLLMMCFFTCDLWLVMWFFTRNFLPTSFYSWCDFLLVMWCFTIDTIFYLWCDFLLLMWYFTRELVVRQTKWYLTRELVVRQTKWSWSTNFDCLHHRLWWIKYDLVPFTFWKLCETDWALAVVFCYKHKRLKLSKVWDILRCKGGDTLITRTVSESNSPNTT